MNKLLERILDIIASDAFPDEDKPYIIREVVSSWNEAKEQVPHTLNQGYDEPYSKGFEAGKQSAWDLQQRELDAKWDAGYLKGVSDAEAKLAAKHATELASTHNIAFGLGKNAGYEERKKHVQVSEDHFYNKGHGEGYQKGKAEGFKEGEKVKHAKLIEELYAAVGTITNQQFKNNGSLATIAGHNIYLKQHMDDAYDKGVKDGMREGFKLGVHTGDTRHKEELDKVSNDKWLEGYNQAKEEYAAEVLKLAYKHEQELETKWREGYNEGRSEPNPTAIHSAEYLKFCEDKAYVKGYEQGHAENGEYFYDNGYADGLAKGRDEMRGDALYLDGYQAGRKAGANEVVNTINKINRGLDT